MSNSWRDVRRDAATPGPAPVEDDISAAIDPKSVKVAKEVGMSLNKAFPATRDMIKGAKQGGSVAKGPSAASTGGLADEHVSPRTKPLSGPTTAPEQQPLPNSARARLSGAPYRPKQPQRSAGVGSRYVPAPSPAIAARSSKWQPPSKASSSSKYRPSRPGATGDAPSGVSMSAGSQATAPATAAANTQSGARQRLWMQKSSQGGVFPIERQQKRQMESKLESSAGGAPMAASSQREGSGSGSGSGSARHNLRLHGSNGSRSSLYSSRGSAAQSSSDKAAAGAPHGQGGARPGVPRMDLSRLQEARGDGDDRTRHTGYPTTTSGRGVLSPAADSARSYGGGGGGGGGEGSARSGGLVSRGPPPGLGSPPAHQGGAQLLPAIESPRSVSGEELELHRERYHGAPHGGAGAGAGAGTMHSTRSEIEGASFHSGAVASGSGHASPRGHRHAHGRALVPGVGMSHAMMEGGREHSLASLGMSVGPDDAALGMGAAGASSGLLAAGSLGSDVHAHSSHAGSSSSPLWQGGDAPDRAIAQMALGQPQVQPQAQPELVGGSMGSSDLAHLPEVSVDAGLGLGLGVGAGVGIGVTSAMVHERARLQAHAQTQPQWTSAAAAQPQAQAQAQAHGVRMQPGLVVGTVHQQQHQPHVTSAPVSAWPFGSSSMGAPRSHSESQSQPQAQAQALSQVQMAVPPMPPQQAGFRWVAVPVLEDGRMLVATSQAPQAHVQQSQHQPQQYQHLHQHHSGPRTVAPASQPHSSAMHTSRSAPGPSSSRSQVHGIAAHAAPSGSGTGVSAGLDHSGSLDLAGTSLGSWLEEGSGHQGW